MTIIPKSIALLEGAWRLGTRLCPMGSCADCCRYFPKIFGPNENEELDKSATLKEFAKMTAEVNAYLKEQDGPAHKPMEASEVAMGFIRVANEAMCRPIRALTQVGPEAVVRNGEGDTRKQGREGRSERRGECRRGA